MFIKLSIMLLSCLLFLDDGCDSKPANQPPTAPAATPASATLPVTKANAEPAAQPALDACRLLEKSEAEAVQGGKLQSTTPGSRADDALVISTCYYTIISADGKKNLSVHLEVMGNDPKNPGRNAVGDLWREKFEGAIATKKKETPKAIPDLGDGAYWLGDNKLGALYALKKDKLVRLSIGGPDEEKAKIDKTKALIEKALRRL